MPTRGAAWTGTNAEDSRDEFETLTRPHLDALYRFAVRGVRNMHVAEDLVQDACFSAYRAFARFERGTDYRAWLFRILANAMLDWQRKRFRRPAEVPLEDIQPGEFALNTMATRRASDPEAEVLTSRLAEEIQEAVAALPEGWQTVVHLSFVEGFAYKEIADILGCPVGTVMSRLYRARQVLRKRLAHLSTRKPAPG
jgi:RNA polymerase sigma-70 factor (ECF subfamily)